MLKFNQKFNTGSNYKKMDNRFQMTKITQFMYDMATSETLELHEAAELLRQNAHTRTIRDTLSTYTKIPIENKTKLQSFLTEKLSACNPNIAPDSIRRKVNNWLKEDTFSISKESAIQLGFALQLNLEETDQLLMKLCEERFHWRNPEEIIYIYALSNNLNYLEATALHNYFAQKGLFISDPCESTTVYTDQVRNRIASLSNDTELEEFLISAQNELGKFHNTAYNLFIEFLELLKNPVMDWEMPNTIDSLSTRDILETYMYRNYIPFTKRPRKTENTNTEKLVFSALQRNIRQNWPDEETLSKMQHRKTDVTRKVLMLLFLATDGGYSSYSEEEFDPLSPEEEFEGMYNRLESMLVDCGFSKLDPRVPFDWMILFCMCTNDSLLIDERIQDFLKEIFVETTSDSKNNNPIP